jgi:putative SOS response-associated peptidase YedK
LTRGREPRLYFACFDQIKIASSARTSFFVPELDRRFVAARAGFFVSARMLPSDGLRRFLGEPPLPDETMTRRFTIMTTAPDAEMSDLHDRMPVIPDEQDWSTWLGRG